MRILLIDDMRAIDKVHNFSSGREKSDEYYTIAVARSYDSGITALLQAPSPWDILYLDHDLGDYKDGKEFTGMHILQEMQAGNVPKPGKIVLVTSNASVRQSMQLIIERLYANK